MFFGKREEGFFVRGWGWFLLFWICFIIIFYEDGESMSGFLGIFDILLLMSFMFIVGFLGVMLCGFLGVCFLGLSVLEWSCR